MTRVALALVLAVAFPTAAIAAPTVAQLAKDRTAAAEKTYRGVVASYKAGRGGVDAVGEWSVRWLDAALADGAKAKQALADHAARMLELESDTVKDVAAGKRSPTESDAATYFRVEADYWVARGKR